DGQDQITMQVLMNTLDFGFAPDRAVTAPRFQTHHFVSSFGQAPPKLGSLMLQRELEGEVAEELRKRGHHVTLSPAPFWHPVAIGIDRKTGELRAAGDPKARRHAAAY